MPRRSGASALTRALGLVGLFALAGCLGRAKAERKGPFLSILGQEAGAVPRSAMRPGAIALALGGLPPEELIRLREHIEESTDAAVRRATAILFDDAGPVPDDAAHAPDPLRQALPDLPALTAAANVLGAPWNAPGLSVKLGPVCDADASRCVPLFAAAVDRDDALVRRGRALAWTLGYAARLRVPAASRAATLRSLREAQARPSGTMALVFGAPRGALDEAELELLHEQARRALAHLARDAPERPWLDALGAARASWELPIPLDPDEVLVIPRLSVLARLQDFHSELELASRASTRATPAAPRPPP
jgi:hypothetical protein